MNTRADNAKEHELDGSIRRSRRNLLGIGTAAGFAGLLATPALSSARIDEKQSATHETDVRHFGARGDGTSDDTAAFQRALDSTHRAGGGTVYTPPGRYLFRDVLTIPEGVTLRGSFSCVPSHTGMRDHSQPKAGDDGTVFLVTAGRGKEDGQPFVTLNTNSSIAGLTIYYPEQVTDGGSG